MGYHYPDRLAGLILNRAFVPALLTACVVAGCDSGPAELAREIDAAREGCTEEMLKAADEECVRMFEAYADMAADAMETYIGGMRAFDEAIQRRGGLQFDTAGLGNAFGDRWRGTADSIGAAASGSYPVDRGVGPASGYAPIPDPYADDRNGAGPGGRWSDAAPTGGASAQTYPGSSGIAGRPAAADPAGRQTPVRRGVLLPPEERLRRPWIDGGDPDDPYVEDEAPRNPPRAPVRQPSGWYPYPDAAPGAYPYPGGVPGAYPNAGPYPYPPAGQGGWYPYPEPGYGEYPYSDSRRGGW